MTTYYKQAVIRENMSALRAFLSALPVSSSDFELYPEVLEAAIEELFERRDNDDVDDVGLSDFDPDEDEEDTQAPPA
jgi:hypothetical protein